MAKEATDRSAVSASGCVEDQIEAMATKTHPCSAASDTDPSSEQAPGQK